jgi:phosphohistidine phosphatase
MGELLKNNNAKPDLIISSPALRAYFTARNIAGYIDYPIEKILADERIYETGVNNLFEYLKELSNELSSVMIFGHNPAFTSLSNYISDKYLENLPTCAYIKMEFSFDKWSEIDNETGKVTEFEYPKKYKKK